MGKYAANTSVSSELSRLEIGDDKKFKMTVVSTTAIDNLVKEMTEVEK